MDRQFDLEAAKDTLSREELEACLAKWRGKYDEALEAGDIMTQYIANRQIKLYKLRLERLGPPKGAVADGPGG